MQAVGRKATYPSVWVVLQHGAIGADAALSPPVHGHTWPLCSGEASSKAGGEGAKLGLYFFTRGLPVSSPGIVNRVLSTCRGAAGKVFGPAKYLDADEL